MSDPVSVVTELDVSRPAGSRDALVSLDVVASASLTMPGLTASVDKIGTGVLVTLRLDRQGALGLLDFEPAFRAPSGMSAELRLPPVTGGGYLEKVDDRELRGAFAANLGLIQVHALAIIGLSEFSMLAILAGEFTPPLQLSFGFTLVGVGGLVGIHRHADREQLSAAASAGELSHLFFPRDPLAEAPHILAIADRCFPYADGGVLVGPMMKVGWGTPTIISATLALIVSTADERTLILGRLALTLPFEQLPLINLEAFITGDIDQNGVRIDATLANSHILGMPVDGELRLRLITAPRPLFALSVGGFFPGYPAPEGMTGMRRLSVALSPGAVLLMRLEAYTAITTASVHLGARVDLQVGVDGFGIRGFGQFDAFVAFEPSFGFETRLAVSVSVVCADFDVAGVDLEGRMSGPAPWHFSGHASVSIAFWDVSLPIPDVKWGDEPDVKALDPRDPVGVLVEALKRAENWAATSAAAPPLVALRAGPGKEAAIHPLGVVGFRQRAIPLETPLQRVDGVRLPRTVTLHVSAVDGVAATTVPDSFVPSQFQDLDDNARLTQTGYVDLPAGIDLTRGESPLPNPTIRHCRHEVKALGETRGRVGGGVRIDPHLLIQGSRARPPVRREALMQERHPRATAVVAPATLTDAAGRPLAAVAAWEMAP